MYIDRIDLSLPETQIEAVLEALGSAAETIQLLPSVSLSDRKHLAKLGLKNEALALQIIEVGRLHPDLITRGIDFEKIDRDRVAREQLLRLKLVLEGLLGKVNDSMLLTGVDLYAAALSIYHSLRRNAGTTSLRDTVNELKKGFARPSRNKKQPEGVPAPALEPVAKVVPVHPSGPIPNAGGAVQRQSQRESLQQRDAAATLEGQSRKAPEAPNSPRTQPVAPAVAAVGDVPAAPMPLKQHEPGAPALFYIAPYQLPIFCSEEFTQSLPARFEPQLMQYRSLSS